MVRHVLIKRFQVPDVRNQEPGLEERKQRTPCGSLVQNKEAENIDFRNNLKCKLNMTCRNNLNLALFLLSLFLF